MENNRAFFLTHSKIEAHFAHSTADFVVEEIPLYEFCGTGEHLILKVRKKNLTTWQLLDIFSQHIGMRVKDIGYAGLKDKEAMTIQHISINKKFEDKINTFSHPQIKILEITKHNNKIKLGHLSKNKFFIRFKKVTPLSATKIEQAIKTIKSSGLPNFFGFQRFGLDRDNHIKGKAILEKKSREKKKLQTLYVNAYQSALFNNWLSKRMELSHLANNLKVNELTSYLNIDEECAKYLKDQKSFFKILKGDVISHYPMGKIFIAEDVKAESLRFDERDISPTGLLPGEKVKEAQDFAKIYEDEFNTKISEYGDRRFAWIFPEILDYTYREENAWFEINFTLPKGSYATVLIEELLHERL